MSNTGYAQTIRLANKWVEGPWKDGHALLARKTYRNGKYTPTPITDIAIKYQVEYIQNNLTHADITRQVQELSASVESASWSK